MGPRKKARKETKASADNANDAPDVSASNPVEISQDPTAATDESSQEPSQSPILNAAPNVSRTPSEAPSTKSNGWYGSWRSKAPAMTKVDLDSVVTPDRPRLESTQSNRQIPTLSTRYMSRGSLRSSKTVVPLAASTTMVNATSGDGRIREARGVEATVEEPPLPPDPTAPKTTETAESDGGPDAPVVPKEPPKPTVSVWRGWWSTPDVPLESTEKSPVDELAKAKDDAKQKPLPQSPEAKNKSDPIAIAGRLEMPASSEVRGQDAKQDGSTASSLSRSSWFWLWSRQQNARDEEAKLESGPPNNASAPDLTLKDSQAAPAVKVSPASEPSSPGEGTTKDAPGKSSGWAFWSSEKPKGKPSLNGGSTHKQVGELAVVNTPSQSHPEAAQFNELEEAPKKDPPKQAKDKRGRDKLRADVARKASSSAAVATPSMKSKQAQAESEAQAQAAVQPAKQNNIILPPFASTYHAAHISSYWEQLRRFIWSAGPDPPRIHLESNPPRIHRALAIGVHGYFPAAIFQRVLGQPTGTSIRFANFAAAAIKEWVAQHGNYECEIEKAALEGEGFIADRVDTLWKLLLNWIEQIRKADFILVAAHSQGVPVAVMLVSKLIQFGCVSAGARIGICALAGVNMGPFIEYKTTLLGSTANELFEFSRPNSKVSLMYEDALDVVLGHGVRITYIGSIDDQLVSLESSTFTPVTHPYIYRAVFVDSRQQQSADFISSLVGFVLKLRNLGVPDHGLIRELSPALAGSLVSGDGHSRLYDDLNVYLLAIRVTLETTLSPGNNPKVERRGLSGKHARRENLGRPGTAGSGAVSATGSTASSNPYFLPWAMRGVLEEELVRKELGDECAELLALFENWKPQSKGLRDVRFRLEAVRSKL